MKRIISHLQETLFQAFEFLIGLEKVVYWRAVMYSFISTAFILLFSFVSYHLYNTYLGFDSELGNYTILEYFSFGNYLFPFVYELSFGLGILVLIFFPLFSGVNLKRVQLDGFEIAEEKRMDIPVFVMLCYSIFIFFIYRYLVHVGMEGGLTDLLQSLGTASYSLSDFLKEYFRVILTWIKFFVPIFLLVYMYRAVNNHDKFPLRLCSYRMFTTVLLLVSSYVLYEYFKDLFLSVIISPIHYIFQYGALGTAIKISMLFLIHGGFILFVFSMLESDLKLWKKDVVENLPVEKDVSGSDSI